MLCFMVDVTKDGVWIFLEVYAVGGPRIVTLVLSWRGFCCARPFFLRGCVESDGGVILFVLSDLLGGITVCLFLKGC